LILAFAAAAPNLAYGWDRQIHRSIVEAALLISPAAEARLGSIDKGALLEATEAPDPSDPDCRRHLPTGEVRDSAARAEELFQQFCNMKGAMATRYFRAQTLGRMAHFVADSAAPESSVALTGSGARFFPSQNFLIFREQGSSGTPLASFLRERGRQSRRGPESEETHAAAYRLAANLVADVFLLLPSEAGGKTAPDIGPVIFAVDRMDTGLGAAKFSYKYLSSDSDYDYYLMNRKADAPGTFLKSLFARRGLHIVEWLAHPQGQSVAVRALLLNNDKRCATHIILSQGEWSAPLPLTLAPFGVKVVEVVSPATVQIEKVSGRWDTYDCPSPHPDASGTSSAQRLIVASSTFGPVFDASVQAIDMTREDMTPASPIASLASGGATAAGSQTPIGSRGNEPKAATATSARLPYFGKRSVLALLSATGVVADLGGCPDRLVKVSCTLRNTSQRALRGLKARLVYEDPYLGKTAETFRSLSPSDLLPGQQAEVSLYQKCDWGRAGGKYTFILDDVSENPDTP
jgi:hypothetical protein